MDIHILLGDLYCEQKQYDSAEIEYKKATDLSPGKAKAHKKLGHVFLAQERFEEAEAAFKKSIELNPSGAASLIDFKIRPPKKDD